MDPTSRLAMSHGGSKDIPADSSGGFRCKVLTESSHPLMNKDLLSDLIPFLRKDIERLHGLNLNLKHTYEQHLNRAKLPFDFRIYLEDLRRKGSDESKEELYNNTLIKLSQRVVKCFHNQTTEDGQTSETEENFLKETLKWLSFPELTKQKPQEAFEALGALCRKMPFSIAHDALQQEDSSSIKQEIVDLACNLYEEKETSQAENLIIVRLLQNILDAENISIDPRTQQTPINYESPLTQKTILHFSQLLYCLMFFSDDDEGHALDAERYLPLGTSE